MGRSGAPWAVRILAGLVFVAALATGELGRTAAGYLVPAAALLVSAILIWLGRGRRLLLVLVGLGLGGELIMDLALALGDGLGHAKHDVAGVAFLVNLAFGGPAMSLLAVPILASLRFVPQVRDWFAVHERGEA